jgi:hypothetical protein
MLTFEYSTREKVHSATIELSEPGAMRSVMRENSFSSNKAKGGARDQGVNEDMQDMHCQGREKA